METIRPDVIRACRPQRINGPRHWVILHHRAKPSRLPSWDGGMSGLMLLVCKALRI